MDKSEGRGLLKKTLLAIKNAGEKDELFVFTDDKLVRNLSKSMGISSYFTQINPENEISELLPYGAITSVNYLEKIIGVKFEAVMISSFRNPLITSEMIDEVIQEYNMTKAKSLISVRKSIDHPVQLNAYYQNIDAGFIYLFDNDFLIEDFTVNGNMDLNYKASKPFNFDWSSKGITKKGNTIMYNRICNGLQIEYIPVAPSFFDEVFTENQPSSLWIWDGPDSARILIQIDDNLIREVGAIKCEEYPMVGFMLDDDPMNLSAFLFHIPGGNEYILNFQGKHIPSCPLLVKCIPLSLSNELTGEIIEVEIPDITIPINLNNVNELTCGIVYVILGIAQNSSYDFKEPFPHNNKLWTDGPIKINEKTGKQISGRQDFPDVFEPDGTFFITQKNLIPLFDKELLRGKMNFFEMEMSSSIQIKSSFDLLRCNAFNKANSHKCQ